MKINRLAAVLIIIGVALVSAIPLVSQTKGLRSISVEDMKYHLRFLGAKEFEGRNAPSVGLNLASKYIALVAEKYGLKPLLPGGSYYQELPLEVSTLSASQSYLGLKTQTGEEKFLFPEAFGMNVRMASPGTVSGELIFLGYGLHAPESNWNDYGEMDLNGKIALILDADLPRDHVLKPAQNRNLLWARGRAARERGAVGVISVIGQAREKNLAAKGLGFDRTESVKFLGVELDQPMRSPCSASTGLFYQVEVRHDVAATILGISRRDLDEMFEAISQGKRIAGKELPGKTLEIKIALENRKATTENVVGYLEGSDSRLKSEYVVIGSHHDHIGTREGKIFPGADDNASGAVAMLELVRAIKAERPKRSVIFVWHTAEEKGLVGAYYFLAHCPVPVDRISADLNLDMVTRNDPNAIYLIGSNKLSTELDGSIRAENGRSVRLKLDYAYREPDHPDRFFFRSDQFPYIRYGIPGVWFFSGTTEDYHQETDEVEKCDFQKMDKITRLVYLVAWDVGNKPSLLKLDINPEITTRGKQNLGFDWFKVREERSMKSRSNKK